MSETTATKTLISHLLASPNTHAQRFEDKLTGGIPDMNVCVNGNEAWCEGKFLKELPKRATTLVRMGSRNEPRLAQQYAWLRSRRNAGGNVCWWLRVARGDGHGWYLMTDDDHLLWIRDGVPKDVLLSEGTKYRNAVELAQAIRRLAGGDT